MSLDLTPGHFRAFVARLPLIALMLATAVSQGIGDSGSSLFSAGKHTSLASGLASSIPHSCRVEVHPGSNVYVTLLCPEEMIFLDLSHSEKWSYSSKSGFQGKSMLFAVECSKP